jgi:hypothetical protein
MTNAIFYRKSAVAGVSGHAFWANPGLIPAAGKTQTGGIFIAPAIIMYDYSFSRGIIGQLSKGDQKNA